MRYQVVCCLVQTMVNALNRRGIVGGIQKAPMRLEDLQKLREYFAFCQLWISWYSIFWENIDITTVFDRISLSGYYLCKLLSGILLCWGLDLIRKRNGHRQEEEFVTDFFVSCRDKEGYGIIWAARTGLVDMTPTVALEHIILREY